MGRAPVWAQIVVGLAVTAALVVIGEVLFDYGLVDALREILGTPAR